MKISIEIAVAPNPEQVIVGIAPFTSPDELQPVIVFHRLDVPVGKSQRIWLIWLPVAPLGTMTYWSSSADLMIRSSSQSLCVSA